MVKSESEENNTLDSSNGKNMSDLSYLIDMMNGKKSLIKGVIDDFLSQIPRELQNINSAIEKTDFTLIKKISHSMKSSVSIMGISQAASILKEMEDLSVKELNLEKIKDLKDKLNLICLQAIEELEIEKYNYA